MTFTSLLPWLAACLLGALGLLFMCYPLYQSYQRVPLDETLSLVSQADNEQAARSALTEVELDYQLGNLDEPEYRTLRERYLRRAFAARKSRTAHDEQLDALIEERLRHMREQHAPEDGMEDDRMGEDDEE